MLFVATLLQTKCSIKQHSHSLVVTFRFTANHEIRCAVFLNTLKADCDVCGCWTKSHETYSILYNGLICSLQLPIKLLTIVRISKCTLILLMARRCPIFVSEDICVYIPVSKFNYMLYPMGKTCAICTGKICRLSWYLA